VNLKEQIKRDEGLRLEAYPDPLTKAEPWTIGYGHTGGVKKGEKITEAEADILLTCDISKAISEVTHHIPFAHSLDEVRFSVLVNMTFNMGIWNLLKFKHTLGCVEKHDYQGASSGMLDSLWAKQVGNRAKRLATQMLTGEWQ
jgi:lysozyme